MRAPSFLQGILQGILQGEILTEFAGAVLPDPATLNRIVESVSGLTLPDGVG